MKAVEITAHGGPDVLKLTDRPMPVAGYGEVVIKLAYAGVNRPDALQRAGLYNPPPTASDLPGLEGAGEVVSLGDGVTNVSIGDQVCALLPGGGYAEFVTTPAAHCLPIPKGLSLKQAACLPETFFTVWSNVFMRGGLQAGERFLVHGGSSGIGTTAIQLANVFGARVFTTAGSDEKCAVCEELGAVRAINYNREDFVEVCQMLTGAGVNVILDMVGGDYVQKNFSACAPKARMISIAFLRGSQVQVDLMPLMLKQLVLTGSTLRSQPLENKARIAAGVESQVWPLIAEGKFKPIIHCSFALAQASEGHALMESNQHIGKILLIN